MPAPNLMPPESLAQAFVFGLLASGAAFVATAVLVLVLGWRPDGAGFPNLAPVFAGGLVAALVATVIARRHIDQAGGAGGGGGLGRGKRP